MNASVQNQIESIASAAGVDPGIAVAVAQQESGGNQSARGAAGEIGIFQLMPATAASLGVNPTDQTSNIQGGVNYLSQLYSEFGNWGDALAAYNWGPGNVQNAGSGNYPASVASYVNSVLNMASSYGSAEASQDLVALETGQPLPSGSIFGSLSGLLPTTPMGMAAAGVGAAIFLSLLLD